MKLFLGIDVGTSLIKAAVYDLYGRKIATSSVKVPVLYPREGYAEQNMDDVWNGVSLCVKKLLSGNDFSVNDIAAMSCAGQGDGLWSIDKYGKPVGNAILWLDNRAAGSVERWSKSGISERFFSNTGTTIWPGCSAAILDWLKENDRDYYNRIDTFFYCKDWINFKLTGNRATDISDGTIPFMDIHKGEISLAQMELLGFDSNLYQKAAKILSSYELVGNINAEAAEKTGLPKGLPVFTGMLDVAANAIAAGAIHTGQTFSIIGTTLLNAVLLDYPVVEPKNIGFMVTSPLPGQWLKILGSLSGTPNFDWLIREIFDQSRYSDVTKLYDEITEELKNVPPGAGKVMYLPFIHGERSPFVNPYATACFLGIRENTTKIDLVKAVFEGVALATRHNLVSIGKKVDEIVVTGGGSSNEVWCQIFADINDAQIRVPARKELGTLGAAINAAKGLGEINDFKFESIEGYKDLIYKPNEKYRVFYDRLYDLYIKTVENMKEYWRFRNELT